MRPTLRAWAKLQAPLVLEALPMALPLQFELPCNTPLASTLTPFSLALPRQLPRAGQALLRLRSRGSTSRFLRRCRQQQEPWGLQAAQRQLGQQISFWRF